MAMYYPSIPFLDSELGAYPNLVYMERSSNKIFGQLSYRWGECRSLTMLRLSNNNLTGEIPMSMGRLPRLGVLDLSSNNLEGDIPSELGSLKILFQLSLGNIAPWKHTTTNWSIFQPRAVGFVIK